jgi:hypothetical protein
MKIKTSELTGHALNYAVILAKTPRAYEGKPSIRDIVVRYPYSTEWAFGGPIIDRKGIGLLKVRNRLPHQQWEAGEEGETETEFWGIVCGPTPLIAAMRCYVMGELGDEVDVPDELTMLEGVSK